VIHHANPRIWQSCPDSRPQKNADRKLRAQADLLESEIAAEAEALLDRFIAGENLVVEDKEPILRVAEDSTE
jgi:ribosome assembly protein YihI (activator of Der GTPase)